MAEYIASTSYFCLAIPALCWIILPDLTANLAKGIQEFLVQHIWRISYYRTLGLCFLSISILITYAEKQLTIRIKDM